MTYPDSKSTLIPTATITRQARPLGFATTESRAALWVVEARHADIFLCRLSLPDLKETWSAPLTGTRPGPNTAFLRLPLTRHLCVLSPNEDEGTLGWELSESSGSLTITPMPHDYSSFVEYAWNDGPRSFLRDGDGGVFRRAGPNQWVHVPRPETPRPFADHPLHVWRWRADGDGVFGLWRVNGQYSLGFNEPATTSGRTPLSRREPWLDAPPDAPASSSFADFLADSSGDFESAPDRAATDIALAREGLFIATPLAIRLQIGTTTRDVLQTTRDFPFTWIDSVDTTARDTKLLVTASSHPDQDLYKISVILSAW